MRFEKTETGHIRRAIGEEFEGLRYGEVTKVYEPTTEDVSTFEVDVVTYDQERHYRNVPVVVNTPGTMTQPVVGDVALLGFIHGENQAPILIGTMYTPSNKSPRGNAGDYRLKRGGLYIEAEADGSSARLAKKTDDMADPSVTIEIDDSGEAPVVKVKDEDSNMGLELNTGTGEFKLGDGGGYGIVSDGDGNFKWFEQSIDFIDDGSTIDW